MNTKFNNIEPIESQRIALAELRTLGCAIIVHEFKIAARLFRSRTCGQLLMEEASASLIWIKGGGLTECIKYFQLPFEAKKLRAGYFSIITRKIPPDKTSTEIYGF